METEAQKRAKKKYDEVGYDIGDMKFFSDASLTIEIDAKSLTKEAIQKILGGIPIVRCKDCKRWKDPHDYECPYHTSGDPYIDDDPEENFFCALGEVK